MKPQRVKTGAVTDEQGRQRFHGAFTGGFSAGYFNTVGSAEGFTPAAFHSSRSQRAAAPARSARDYMDEEDGLLGGSLTAKKEVDSFLPAHQPGEQSAEYSDRMRVLLSDLVAQPTNTMGKKLLGRLGWKPGQGIGPRRKMASAEGLGQLPAASLQEGFVTVAPREEVQTVELPPAKADLAGIGYVNRDSLLPRQEGAEEGSRYRVSDLFKPRSSQADSQSRVGGHQSRAIGSMYLEEDEDIAFDDGVDESFSFEAAEDALPSSAKKAGLQKDIDSYFQGEDVTVVTLASTVRCPSDNKPPIPGFHVAKNPQLKLPHFPMPAVPKDFAPTHKFPPKTSMTVPKPAEKEAEEVVTWKVDTAGRLESRAQQWRDEPAAGKEEKSSVFNLLKPHDKERILQLAANLNPTAIPAPEPPKEQPKEKVVLAEKPRPLLVNPTVLNSSFAALSDAFRNRFTKSSNGEGEQASKDVVKEGMATAEEYSKLSAASQQAQQAANKGDALTLPSSGQSNSSSAVTRTTSMWEPASLLCKRCNVKEPDMSRSAMLVTPGGSLEAGKKKTDSQLDRLLPASVVGGSHANGKKPDLGEPVVKESNVEEDVFLKPSLATSADQAAASLAVFKSIFDDDDDDSEDDSGSESDSNEKTEQPQQPAAANSKQEKLIDVAPPVQPADMPKAPSFIPRSQRGTIASSSGGVIGSVVGSSNAPKRDLNFVSSSRLPHTKTRTLISAISSEESDQETGLKVTKLRQDDEQRLLEEAAQKLLSQQEDKVKVNGNGKRTFDQSDDEDDDDVAAERRRRLAASRRKRPFTSSLVKPADISATDASAKEEGFDQLVIRQPSSSSEFITSTPTPIQHVVMAAEASLSQLSDSTPAVSRATHSFVGRSTYYVHDSKPEDALGEEDSFQVLPARPAVAAKDSAADIHLSKAQHSREADSGEESDIEAASSASSDDSNDGGSSDSDSSASSQHKKAKKAKDHRSSKKSHRHHKDKKAKKASKKAKKEKKTKHHKKSAKRSKH